ncbi:MAG: hypothetical protein FWF84_06210 [Kiritimatiellaeota bacterium]|nr:hypothetical protein [Kiritimatiellota bacterium]
MKRIVAVVACCVVCVSAGFARGEKPTFALEVESYQALSSDVMALANLIGQPMLGGAALGMGIGPALGVPGMVGVDQDKPIRVALYMDMGAFDEDSDAGAEIVIIVPLMKGAEPLSMYPHVKRVGDWAIVSPNSETRVALVAAEFEKNPQAFSVTGIPGTLRVRQDIGTTVGSFKKLVASMDNDALPPELASFFAFYMGMFMDVVSQMTAQEFSLQCDATGITFRQKTEVAEGSMFAKVFAESKAPSDTLRRAMPADALFASVDGTTGARMRHVAKPMLEKLGAEVLPFATKAVEKVIAENPEPIAEIARRAPALAEVIKPQSVADLWAFMMESVDYMGDESGAFLAPAGKGVTLSGIAKNAKGKKQIELTDKTMDFLVSVTSAFPVKVVKKERTAYGAKVVSCGIAFPPEALAGIDSIPVPGVASILRGFTDCTLEYADAGEYFVDAIGMPGALDATLAMVKGPSKDNAFMERMTTLFPEAKGLDKAVGLWYFRPMATVKVLTPLFEMFEEVASELAALPDDGAGIGGYETVTPTSQTVTLRVSASQIRAIAHVVADIQKRMMQTFEQRMHGDDDDDL